MKTQESHIVQTEWYVDWERKFQNILSVCKIRIKLQCVEQYTKKKSCLQFLKIWKARFDAFLFIWGLVVFTDFHDFIFCHCYMLQDVINTYLSMYMQLLFAFLVHTYASFYDLFPDYMQICLKPCMPKGTIKWSSLCT